MAKVILTLIIAATLIAGFSGCKSSSGSREFIPGKGWVPND